MRILVSANPMYGHFLPLVPLAVELRDRGHDIVVATGPGFVPTAEAYGLRATGVGRDLSLDDVLAVLPDIFEVAPEDQDAYARPRVFVELRAHNAVDDLLALTAEWHPDLIIREDAEFASWAVAERLSIPQVTVTAGAVTTADAWDAFAVPWFRDLGRRIGVDSLTTASLYRHGVVSFEPAGYNDWSGIPTARVFRPATPSLAAHTITGLDELDDRPLIYVTLGTEFYNADLMTSILTALGDGRWNIVATTGPQGSPDDVDPGVPHVLLAKWVSQDVVLDRASAVVSHAGAGTTIGALVRGLPMVCVPQGADQFEHARRVTELGAGVALDQGRRSPEEIRAAVTTVLSDPSYRAAAAELAAATARLPDVHAAALHLERI